MTDASSIDGIGRRRFLAGAAIAGAATALDATGRARSAHADGTPRELGSPNLDADVYVIVVDGLRKDELHLDLTPTLTSLADAGTRYVNAEAINVAETLPNHAAMMTGVYPDRSGVPVNKIYDRELDEARDLDRPDDLWAATLLDRVRNELGLTTASVLSKRYLHGLFGDRASVVWAPSPLIPGTEHAPDQFTVDALLRIIDEHRPRLTFVNLGDVDRVGHIDLTGPSARVARTAAVRNADAQVHRFVTHLRQRGLWERSVVLVLADHSMDWSIPTNVVHLSPTLGADPLLAGNVAIAQNGGAATVYYLGDSNGREAAIDRIIDLATRTLGVQSAIPTSRTRLGERAGDVIIECSQGWRVSDPHLLSNPIPGNHGHGLTLPIPFFITGGHGALASAQLVSEPVLTLDVAPTVAALFGLGAPAGGWDAIARLHALH